jgi:hypothetical protein
MENFWDGGPGIMKETDSPGMRHPSTKPMGTSHHGQQNFLFLINCFLPFNMFPQYLAQLGEPIFIE